MIEYTYDISTFRACKPTTVVASSPIVAVAKLLAKRAPRPDEGQHNKLKLVYEKILTLEFTVQSESSRLLYFLKKSSAAFTREKEKDLWGL